MALSFNLQQEPNIQIPQEQQFAPQFDENQTRQLANQYQQAPGQFDNTALSSLVQHAQYHQVPFDEGDFSFKRALMEVGKGFFSGFTTLEIGEHPTNVYEGIARNIGHLAGFAPGIMSGPLKAVGALGLARHAAALNKASIPMRAADFATRKAKRMLGPLMGSASRSQYKAMNTASEFILGNKTRHILEGAFHLGTASAVSSWQQGIDSMMTSFLHGAGAGAAFRGLGNLVNSGDKAADTVVKGIAGSLFMGLPSTMRGATAPEQIYDYLLGAYFGGKETSWAHAKAGKAVTDMEKHARTNPVFNVTREPSTWKGFGKLEPEVQEKVVEYYDKNLSGHGRLGNALFEAMGIDPAKATKEQGKVVEKMMGLTPKDEIKPDKVIATEKVGDDVIARYIDIEAEKSRMVDDISTLETALKTAKKADKVIIKKQLKDLRADLKKSDTIMEKIGNLAPDEVIDIHEKIHKINDINLDTGSASNASLGSRALGFVRKNVINETEGVLENKTSELELASIVQKDVKDFAERKRGEILSAKPEDKISLDTEKLATDISKKMDKNIGLEGRKDIRRWATEEVFGKNIVFASTDGNQIKINPTIMTLSGRRKQDIAPKTPLEDAFTQAGGVIKGHPKKVAPSVIMLDTVTRYVNGKQVDLGLADYKQLILKENQWNKSTADFKYRKFLGKMAKRMAKKGYYAFGGIGDKGKIIYTKFHPNTKTKGTPSKILKEVGRLLDTSKHYQQSLKEFKKKFPGLGKEAKALHDAASESNILYDLQMNFGKDGINVKNVRKLLGKGFIKDGIAFNKRMQIWMTTGYNADADFIKRALKIAAKNKPGEAWDDIGPNGELNYIITPTTTGPKAKKDWVNIKNTKLEEHNDGGIIIRDDMVSVFNLDAGVPASGQNKSFIVSPHAEHGAMLGKYMFHNAGAEQSRAMKKAGIHMIIPQAAAKQHGTRYAKSDYKMVGEDTMQLSKGSVIYKDLLPEHIKYDYGTKQGPDFIKPKKIFKQVWSSMTALADKPFNQEVTNDMFDVLVRENFRGDEAWNTKLKDYLKSPTDKGLQELKENIDKIGVKNLLDVLHTNNGTAMADSVYALMTKMNMRVLNEMASEGEITREQAIAAANRVEEFSTGTDRILREAMQWKANEEAKGNSVSALPLYLHKYVRDYRMSVMRNVIVENATRPKVENSATSRIRIYDKELQKRFPELNSTKKNADEHFYLDNDINPVIETHLPGKWKKTRLRTLWEAYQRGEFVNNKADVEEILRAGVVRIPMDSVSGLRALKFGGFTGRSGHGILMHGRAMKALGGADADGDSAYIYFGGRKGDQGKGWKKSWKDEFHKNKDEYLEKDKTSGKFHTPERKTGNAERPDGMHAKKTMRDILTRQDPAEKEHRDSKVYQYSPYWRVEVAERAEQGRKALGGAVNMPQVMRAVYDVILNSKSKQDSFTVAMKYGKNKGKYVVTIKPRTDEKWIKYANKMAAAQIAFGSDPLDEAGLKDYNVFFRELMDAHFDVSVFKNGKKYKDPYGRKREKNDISFMFRKNGYYNEVNEALNAFFSKNYTDNRKFMMHEIQDMTRPLSDPSRYTEAQLNNPLLKMAHMMRNIDWSDSVYRRINWKNLKKAYKDIKDFTKKFPEEAKLAYGKKTFDIEMGKYIQRVRQYKLHTAIGFDAASKDAVKFNNIIKGTRWDKEGIYKISKEGNIDFRRGILKRYVEQMEDFLVNDITDMVTIRLANKIMADGDIPGSRFAKIHNTTERLKRVSYLRNLFEQRGLEFGKQPKEQTREELAEILDKVDEANIKSEKMPMEKLTLAKNQNEIDNFIMDYKKKLSAKEKKLFDYLMMGSMNRGHLEKMNKAWNEALKTKSKIDDDKYYSLMMDSSMTSTSKLGYNSRAIPSSTYQEFLGEFSRIMSGTWKPMDIEVVKEVGEKVRKSKEVIMGDGTKIKGNLFEEGVIEEVLKDTVVGDINGFEKLYKGELSTEEARVVSELADHLKFYNNKMGIELNEITRGIPFIRKNIAEMNLRDFQNLNNYFNEIRRGSWWQRLFKENTMDMRKRYHHLFAEGVSDEMMKYEMDFYKTKGYFFTGKGEGVAFGKMRLPTTALERLMTDISNTTDRSVALTEDRIKGLREDLFFLNGLGEDGRLFQRISAARREVLKRSELTDHFEPEKKAHIADIINNRWNNEYKDAYEGMKNKDFTVTESNGDRVTYKGDKLIQKISKVYTDLFKEAGTILRGKEGVLNPFTKKNKEGELQFYDKEKLEPVIDIKKFIKYVRKLNEINKPIPLELGIDGLRQIQRSLMVEFATSPSVKARWRNYKLSRTGTLNSEGYWPHMFFSKEKATEAMTKALEEVRDDPRLDDASKLREYKKIQFKHYSLNGDWINTVGEDWMEFDRIESEVKGKGKMSQETIRLFDNNRKFSNMHQRTSYVEGYSFDAVVPETYLKNMYQNFHQHLSQIMARDTIHNWAQEHIKKGWDKIKEPGETYSLMGRWVNFFKLYVQDSMGHPSIIPERMYNDPSMKIKGTPYGWFADNTVKKRLDKIAKTLGISKGIKGLPESTQGISYEMIQKLSQMEAKYELASLLAHPKSAITNIFGGTMHTIQSTGTSYFKKARDIEYIKRIIPEINSKDELTEWVISQGVFPEMIAHEFGLGPELRKANNKAFIDALSKKVTKTGDIERTTMVELAKEHGITEAFFQKAAKFMSVPEKMLRRDAFMAHYIKAWENFGGAIKDPTHPFLIEMAKKGVKATQFLYSAPFRPAFARSALGKVMTRFQLWAWNSARFRNDIRKQARVLGLKEGTEVYEKFKRTTTIDLFVIALANIFAYSLFDNALPAPYNWLQDTSEWIFGDENARNRAFFGTWPSTLAPLQLITPPIARLPISGLKGFIDNDYSRLADYYIWTALPFGRIIRDVNPYVKGNLIENPIRVFEKMAGMPLMELQRKSKGFFDDDDE